MIEAHQATIFPSRFLVATSSMKNGAIRHPNFDTNAPEHLRAWCNDLGVSPLQTVGLYITYGETRGYTDIVELTSPVDVEGACSEKGWVKADALITATSGIAMILPVADCNAVVYVDPVQGIMALAHIGWHSTVHNLAAKVVSYMGEQYGSEPKDILIYNSPSIRVDSYRFTYLEQTVITHWHAEPYAILQPDGRYAIDLVQYNYDQWITAGILPEHIEVVGVDTAQTDDYPSHFAGQKSRFAVLAMIGK